MAKAKTTATPTGEVKKNPCPITREQFKAKAPVLTIQVNNGETGIGLFTCGPKDFSTGSMGWGANDKMTVLIDGVPTKVQVTLNLTVVGSKELPGAPK